MSSRRPPEGPAIDEKAQKHSTARRPLVGWGAVPPGWLLRVATHGGRGGGLAEAAADAVNRREYARAFSYWEPVAAETELPPFDQFVLGYADTASVDLTLGDIGTGVGAGQIYFSVPVTLVATQSDGSSQMFVRCYTLHLGRPQLQAVAPVQPLAIQRANIQQVDNDADTAGLMGRACPTV